MVYSHLIKFFFNVALNFSMWESLCWETTFELVEQLKSLKLLSWHCDFEGALKQVIISISISSTFNIISSMIMMLNLDFIYNELNWVLQLPTLLILPLLTKCDFQSIKIYPNFPTITGWKCCQIRTFCIRYIYRNTPRKIINPVILQLRHTFDY